MNSNKPSDVEKNVKQCSNKIVVEAIHKSFESGSLKVQVLKDINWTIKSGEMTFLVGPSGCGKTTLISIIAGILTPTQGRVNLFGNYLCDMAQQAATQFRRENIGFIFQQFNLLPALTASENVSIPLVLKGQKKKPAIETAHHYLDLMGMADHRDKLSRELSGGQQQRIAIARALIHEPRLLICDEPTASLDSITGKQIMELLQMDACKKDRCVIIVTHDTRIFPFSDLIVNMNDGGIQYIEKNDKEI